VSLVEPALAAKTHNIFNGMVRLPDGKMSSRTGKIIRAEDVLDEAEARVAELAKDEADDSVDTAVARIALAAVKFGFLKQAIGNDIAFSFDESLSFQGKSGPYVLYTRVRCLSLLEKAGVSADEITNAAALVSDERVPVELAPAELALIRWLYRLPETVSLAVANQAPHHVVLFAYELAQRFSVFYDTVPVLKEQDEQKKLWRLSLVQATAHVLTQALHVVAIPTVEKM
jgi:arginyl-tRNA synthetase